MKSKIKWFLRKLDLIFSKKLFKVDSILSNKFKNSFYEQKRIYPSKTENNLEVFSSNTPKRELLIETHQNNQSRNNNSSWIHKIKGDDFLISKGGFVIYRKRHIIVESCNHEEIYFWRYLNKVGLKLGLYLWSRKKVKHGFAVEHILDFNYWHLHAELLASLGTIVNEYFAEGEVEKLTVFIRPNFSGTYREMILYLYSNYIELKEIQKENYQAEFIYLNSELYSIIKDSKDREIQIRNIVFWQKSFKVFNSNSSQPIDTSRRINFISRRKASSRRIINENELISFLSSEGLNINVVILEELPWLEQISLFNNSKVIIGVHGAHSATILYSNPSTYLELVSINRKRGIFPLMEQIDICLTRGVNHVILDLPDAVNEEEDYYIDSKTAYIIYNNLINNI
jgi:hypothetical protein